MCAKMCAAHIFNLLDYMTMRTKQLISYPTLNDKHGDPSKDWYVEYAFRLPGESQEHRYRIYRGLKRTVSIEERRRNAEIIIAERTAYIKSGRYLSDPGNTTPLRNDDNHRQEWRRHYQIEQHLLLDNIITEYLVNIRGTIRTASYRKYTGEYNIFSQWSKTTLGENVYIGDFNPEQIQHFFDYLAADEHDGGRGLCHESIKQYRMRLCNLFDYARKTGLYTRDNPCMDIRNRGKYVDLAPAPFSQDERTRLKNAIRPNQPYLWLAIELMYYSAIRPGEARLLKVGDIDQERKIIRIVNSVSKNKKTQNVGISDDTLHLMKELGVFAYSPDLYLFGQGGIPSDKPLGKSTMRERFLQYRRELHIDDSRKLYSWKHTGAIEALEHGMNIVQLKDHMRHANIDTSMRYAKKRTPDAHAADAYIPKI